MTEHSIQFRAAAVVVHEGFVLLHQRAGDAFWALPGGRIERGEDARSALVREMNEELSAPIDCGELLYVVENFFNHGGQPHHEIGLYFLAQFNAATPLLDKSKCHRGVEGLKRLDFQWFAPDELPALDLRPAFLRGVISQPVLAFQHLVQRC
ncbi:8-oxo-dGTP pyrophosphatase MutT (NUDIX family) [Hydrogenophaga palleronii]|uniref:8-oxo-dGTP pyrophosphatase MutT (NUDIX family) n=1 Tax=Hydrogenophaga palleronii TaxID=65655 RepID=A0ABU1WQ32_9BURK|nr:NUDIX domain-containing protein [Hydrogenophaga palleronii]MDR7151319.1 8-oxo-dGTP pyrophosphatase MutT (NUDIX family) [Hydrogenophaga palleronii]